MEVTHWQAMVFVAVFLAALLGFALCVRLDGRVHRLTQRLFLAGFGLYLAHQAGWMAVNGVTLAVAMAFGVPGLAAMAVLMQF